VPTADDVRIPAVLPMAAVKDWTPMRVAVIGTWSGSRWLLGTLFVVRTVRRRRVRQDG